MRFQTQGVLVPLRSVRFQGSQRPLKRESCSFHGCFDLLQLAPSREAFALSVEVTDTGAGHAADEAEGQFQPFGQSRSEPGGGAGEGPGGAPSLRRALQGGAGAAENGGPDGGAGHSQSSGGSGGALLPGASLGVHPGADGAFRGSGLGMAMCQQFAQVRKLCKEGGTPARGTPARGASRRVFLLGSHRHLGPRACACGGW